MTRSIKGFKVDWGDRWRHSAWAERETAPKHMYWFDAVAANVIEAALRTGKEP